MAWTTLIPSEAVGEHNTCWTQQLCQWLGVLKARLLPWLQPQMVAISGMFFLDPRPLNMLEVPLNRAFAQILLLGILCWNWEPSKNLSPAIPVSKLAPPRDSPWVSIPIASILLCQWSLLFGFGKMGAAYPFLPQEGKVLSSFAMDCAPVFVLAESKGPQLHSDHATAWHSLGLTFFAEPRHVQQMSEACF